MKLLDIGALQQSSQSLSGLKGGDANAARGLFKQLLGGGVATLNQSNQALTGKGTTLNADEAMDLIEKWLTSPQEGLNDDLIAALEALQSHSLDESELQSLEALFKKMETLVYGEKDEEKTVLVDQEQLIQVHFFLYNVLNQNQLGNNDSLIQEVQQKGSDFLGFLAENGADEKLIQQLKEQFFSQDSSSKLTGMSQRELKQFNQLIDHMMSLTKGSEKEWKISMGELKESISPRFEPSLPSQSKGTSSLEWLLRKELGGTQASSQSSSESKPNTQLFLPGHKQFFQVQSTSPVQLTGQTEERPATVDQQILSTWKQMKFTPFGKSSGSFTVRLNPENLGFITIQLTKQNGVYASRITASTQAAKELLEHHLPQLKQALPNMSVQIDRFNIPLQSNEQPFLGQFTDDNKQQQQKHQDAKQSEEQEAEFQDLLDELVLTDEGQEEM
ncbi:flagellar hook-length control protein FliK [Bacillus sp. NPDC077027]|uniref:flagellar hook-length control protein FliK n=1 Tax=Bacillus sp. NPDC077027 TaxID=3390548 RepID=UPI003CFC3452